MFTVDSGYPRQVMTAQWSSISNSTTAPPPRPSSHTSQDKSRPTSNTSSGEEPPPPYTPATTEMVYDPNATDELHDWEDRNN